MSKDKVTTIRGLALLQAAFEYDGHKRYKYGADNMYVYVVRGTKLYVVIDYVGLRVEALCTAYGLRFRTYIETDEQLDALLMSIGLELPSEVRRANEHNWPIPDWVEQRVYGYTSYVETEEGE